MSYFSERERGLLTRDQEEINEQAWGGIQALIKSLVENGAFGATYPKTCPDGVGTIGTGPLQNTQKGRPQI